MFSDVAVIVPARIGSTRLPKKLLEKIGDKAVIEHVINNITQIGLSSLFVATDCQEIAELAEKNGVKAIMTKEDCPTGSDRVFEAFQKIENNDKIKFVINIQGDMPFIGGEIVRAMVKTYHENNTLDIITPVVKVGEDVASSSSNVKVVASKTGKALYFSRSMIPFGSEEFLYHVGIYGFKPEALAKFVALPKGKYEICESLEQLRALENGMNIGIFVCDEIPISIDTAGDLEKARLFYTSKNI